MDERDQLIGRRAQLVTYRIFWVCFVSACLLTYFVAAEVNHATVIPVYFLPAIVFGALFVYLACHSVAVLVQYRLRHTHED